MISNNQPGCLANRYGDRRRQRGVVMPLVVIGLLAIIAMAGLAIDSSHAFVNKTRLQNMVDAAALAAAKDYDETADIFVATAAANNTFGLNTDGIGNFEIDGEYDSGNISVLVQYSETLNPFVSTGIGPYVRVIASGFDMATGFSAVLGIGNIGVGASAVAGPSPKIENYACNIAPMVVCSNEPEEGEEGSDYYGFRHDDLMVLKPSQGDHGDVGPGNYKLLRLGCDSGGGGACLRENMGGSYDACASTSQDVETEPGFLAGPTRQGFNTRFGEYGGPVDPADYPPDVIIQETQPLLYTQSVEDPMDPDNDITQICVGPCDNAEPPTNLVESATDLEWDIFDYETYSSQTNNPAVLKEPGGVPWRRVLAMPVANCTGDQNGQSTLPIIGFACFYMLQKIKNGPDMNIFGQFVEGCRVSGAPGLNPGGGPGPYVIQLYKDPDSGDS